jgi:short-subunit dehydrogenase
MRNALITGASRGIGKAICQELSGRDWNLFLVAQHQDGLTLAASQLANVSGTQAVDLGSGFEAARAVAKRLEAVMSNLDLLVLCAGIFIEESLSSVDEVTFRRNMAVNVDANIYLTRCLLPFLEGGTKPRIIIVGSTAAYEPYPLVPTYGVAKWALRGFAINLRHELMGSRIGVTLLSPGGTLTDMWAGEPMEPNRLLDPHDIAKLIVSITELSEQAVVDEIVVRPILGDIHE